jgi:hypothetical protein
MMPFEKKIGASSRPPSFSLFPSSSFFLGRG